MPDNTSSRPAKSKRLQPRILAASIAAEIALVVIGLYFTGSAREMTVVMGWLVVVLGGCLLFLTISSTIEVLMGAGVRKATETGARVAVLITTLFTFLAGLRGTDFVWWWWVPALWVLLMGVLTLIRLRLAPYTIAAGAGIVSFAFARWYIPYLPPLPNLILAVLVAAAGYALGIFLRRNTR